MDKDAILFAIRNIGKNYTVFFKFVKDRIREDKDRSFDFSFYVNAHKEGVIDSLYWVVEDKNVRDELINYVNSVYYNYYNSLLEWHEMYQKRNTEEQTNE